MDRMICLVAGLGMLWWSLSRIFTRNAETGRWSYDPYPDEFMVMLAGVFLVVCAVLDVKGITGVDAP